MFRYEPVLCFGKRSAWDERHRRQSDHGVTIRGSRLRICQPLPCGWWKGALFEAKITLEAPIAAPDNVIEMQTVTVRPGPNEQWNHGGFSVTNSIPRGTARTKSISAERPKRYHRRIFGCFSYRF